MQMPRNGTPALMRLHERFAQSKLIKRAHHLPEMSDSRQNDFLPRLDVFRLIRDHVMRPELIQRILNGAQIPRPVIDDASITTGPWSTAADPSAAHR